MGGFAEAKAAAYHGCVQWGKTKPVPGSIVTVKVQYPFFCQIGERFFSTFGDEEYENEVYFGEEFIEAKLLDIVSRERCSAVVTAEVLSVRNQLAFVRRLSAEERKELEKQGYPYDFPPGDHLAGAYQQTDKLICFFNDFGGDIKYLDYIYTDEDGVDHLVRTDYYDFEDAAVFFGDEVLGLHKNCPIQWENGLLIHQGIHAVMACADDAENVVIPASVKKIGYFVFVNNPKLKDLTIPVNIQYCIDSFGNCPNLKTIRLIDARSERDILEEDLRKSFPQTEIIYEETS